MAEQEPVWEYHVTDLPYNARARMELLNKLAKDGWELVTVAYEAAVAMAYLRRQPQTASGGQPPA